jgi:hypothetical protein
MAKAKQRRPKAKPKAVVTVHEQAILDQLDAGEDVPTDNATRSRLIALRRKGLVTRERGDDGDTWTLAAKG